MQTRAAAPAEASRPSGTGEAALGAASGVFDVSERQSAERDRDRARRELHDRRMPPGETGDLGRDDDGPVPQVNGVRREPQALHPSWAKDRAVLVPRPEDEHRAHDRQQRAPAEADGIGVREPERERRAQDQQEARGAHRGACPRRARRGRSRPVREPAGAHLPGAGRQREERGRRTGVRLDDVPPERHRGERADDQRRRGQAASARAEPRQRHQQQRIEQIELPLDGQGPGVQQPVPVGAVRVVPAPPEEEVVRPEGHRGERLARELAQVRGRQQERPEEERDAEGRAERGPDARRARSHEAPVAERPRAEPAVDDAGHQVPRDDEEDVDPDEPSARALRPQVKQEDQRDAERAEAVDVLPERRGLSGRTGRRQLRMGGDENRSSVIGSTATRRREAA